MVYEPVQIKMEDLQEFYAKVDDNRDGKYCSTLNHDINDNQRPQTLQNLKTRLSRNKPTIVRTLGSKSLNFDIDFGKMMAKVRTEAEAQLQAKKNEKKAAQKSKRETEKTEGDSEKQDSERVYLPRTFGNLLNFLTYENKKHDLINFVKVTFVN